MGLQDLLPGIGTFVLSVPWLKIGAGLLLALVLWALQAAVRRLVRGKRKESKYRHLGEPKPLGERYNPKEGQCLLFIGRLGSGKTSLMVSRGVRHARRHSIPIITNAAIRDDGLVVYSWNELRELPTCVTLGVDCVNGCHEHEDSEGCCPAVVMLDELHLWYPSQTTLMPATEQQEAFEILSYARKRGWTVLATSQSLTRVHTGFRQLLSEVYRVFPLSPGYWHKASLIDPDTNKVLLATAAMFSPRRARYNTRAEVTPLWVTGGRRPGRRTEPEPGRAEPPGPAVDLSALLAARRRQVVPAMPSSVASSTSVNETDSVSAIVSNETVV